MKSRREKPEPQALRDARSRLSSAIIRGEPAEIIDRLREAVRLEEARRASK